MLFTLFVIVLGFVANVNLTLSNKIDWLANPYKLIGYRFIHAFFEPDIIRESDNFLHVLILLFYFLFITI